ncbi:hypothetical protein CMV_020219 [Castanea mollissima]|uniref:Uncharacterized protein n=1 Tax=Castanea mollissima TaxID=60419 RepID=A0A8J4VLY8_9ROSI|nr:hypothetical protein CMV_020219 [Castanea mollissima]
MEAARGGDNSIRRLLRRKVYGGEHFNYKSLRLQPHLGPDSTRTLFSESGVEATGSSNTPTCGAPSDQNSVYLLLWLTCSVSLKLPNSDILMVDIYRYLYSCMVRRPLISQLSQFTYLNLSDNSFFGPVPASISSLSNLQTLFLRSNSFSGSIPVSITNLKSLDSLDNSLTGFLPNSINSLSNLRRLDLSYNKLTRSLPPNLLELALKHNSLSGYLSNSSFDGLKISWKWWNSAKTHSRGHYKLGFFLLPSLQQVDLANYSLTCVEVWKPTSGNSNLVAIDLGFNSIACEFR